MANSSLALTLGNISIRQLDGLFSLNDLHKASGSNPSQRPGNFLGIDQTKALIAEIVTAEIPAVKTKEGRNGGTYACRELVIAYAAWISAAFHLKVIRVFLDSVQPDIERIAYSVGATDTLSAAQAEQLRLIFKNKCATLPESEQAAFMIQGWSKLKSHFGVAYRKIEQREFHEALSLATRHAADWTNSKALKPPVSMAALPAPQPSQTLQLMRVTSGQGGTTVDLFPASELPSLLMSRAMFSDDEALKIAMHANLRMHCNVVRTEASSKFEQLKKDVRGLSAHELMNITQEGWLELATRTTTTNAMN